MATPRDVEARLFYRVAFQRLEDGELLLDKLDRPNASIYLTGYAIECMIKAMIIMQTPSSQRTNVIAGFRGQRAHNILWLREQLTRTGVVIPAALAREFRFVNTWSTDMRYEPGRGNRADAERFTHAAKSILAWLDGRM